MAVIIRAGALEAAKVNTANIDEPLMVFLDGQAQRGGDLVFTRGAVRALLDFSNRGFNLFRTLTLLPGGPVQTTQAVENCTPDLIFGVSLQLDIMRRVEPVYRGYQPHDAAGNEILEIYRIRKPLVNAPGDQAHLREVFQDEALPLFRRCLTCLVSPHDSNP